MKNFLQPGLSLDLIAPGGGVVSGVALLIGTAILAVPTSSKAVGETFSGLVEGVVELPKLTTDVMAVGDKVNFNTGTGELQLATSTLDNCATVVVAAGNGVLVVKARLTPV